MEDTATVVHRLTEKVERQQKIIERQQKIVERYEYHHTHCDVLAPTERAALTRALSSVAPQQQQERGSPSPEEALVPATLPPSEGPACSAAGLETSNDLSVIQYQPDSTLKKRKRHVDAATRATEPRKAAHTFVRLLPSVANLDNQLRRWRRSAFQLPRLEDGDVSSITGRNSGGQRSPRIETSCHGRIRAAGQQTALLLTQADDAKSLAERTACIARFHLLFFLSYCIVLEKLGSLSEEEIDVVMRETLGEISHKKLARFRQGALFVNQDIIVSLCRLGIPLSRATALIYFCGPRTAYGYDDIYHPQSWPFIAHAIQHEHNDLLSSSGNIMDLSIPGLIGIWEPSFSTAGVRQALGYPEASTWSSLSRTSPNTPIRPSNSGSVLTSLSHTPEPGNAHRDTIENDREVEHFIPPRPRREPLEPRDDDLVDTSNTTAASSVVLDYTSRDESERSRSPYLSTQFALTPSQPIRIPHHHGESANQLLEFYLIDVCGSRTILKGNAYADEFVRVLAADDTFAPILALSASYRKEHYERGSIERRRLENIECAQIVSAAEGMQRLIVQQDLGHVTAVTTALFIHHATLNPMSHPRSWIRYFYQIQDPGNETLDAHTTMASVAILAATALPTHGKHHFQNYNYDWVGRGDPHFLSKFNTTLGLSRMMIHFIHSINVLARKRGSYLDMDLLWRRIELASFWVDESNKKIARYIALVTAETYRLAAQLYFLARLYGYTPSHPDVVDICDNLIDSLHILPTDGELYSSMHPAWSFVIACACTGSKAKWLKLLAVMEKVAGDFKNNVDGVCYLIKRIREWQVDNVTTSQQDNWWEDMTRALEGDNVICLA